MSTYNSPALNLQSASQIINWPKTKPEINYDLQDVQDFRIDTRGFYPASEDTVYLGNNSSGAFWAGPADDKFVYNSIGTKNTLLNGGQGEDSLVIGLNAEKALQFLKDKCYSLVQYNNGLGLRTNDGQEIKVTNIEKVCFQDKTYNLCDSNDVEALVNAFKCKGIPIINQTNSNNLHKPVCSCGQGLTGNNNNYIPIFIKGGFASENNYNNTPRIIVIKPTNANSYGLSRYSGLSNSNYYNTNNSYNSILNSGSSYGLNSSLASSLNSINFDEY